MTGAEVLTPAPHQETCPVSTTWAAPVVGLMRTNWLLAVKPNTLFFQKPRPQMSVTPVDPMSVADPVVGSTRANQSMPVDPFLTVATVPKPLTETTSPEEASPAP